MQMRPVRLIRRPPLSWTKTQVSTHSLFSYRFSRSKTSHGILDHDGLNKSSLCTKSANHSWTEHECRQLTVTPGSPGSTVSYESSLCVSAHGHSEAHPLQKECSQLTTAPLELITQESSEGLGAQQRRSRSTQDRPRSTTARRSPVRRYTIEAARAHQ